MLPILTRLVEDELTEAGAHHYQVAARRLKKMRQLAGGTDKMVGVDGFLEAARDPPPSPAPPARVRPRGTP